MSYSRALHELLKTAVRNHAQTTPTVSTVKMYRVTRTRKLKILYLACSNIHIKGHIDRINQIYSEIDSLTMYDFTSGSDLPPPIIKFCNSLYKAYMRVGVNSFSCTFKNR